MLCSRLVFLLTVLLHPFLHVAALRSQLRGHVISPQLWKRDHISALDNSQNLLYYTNITLGEKQLSVSIDTGSSDLWVVDNILNSNDTGVSTSVQYAIGDVSGNIRTAPLTFVNFSIPDQAFIQVRPSSTLPQGQGLLGLGPNSGSNIHDALKKQPAGDTVLDRIFRQDPSTPNILTVLLSRSDDPNEQYPGQITVSDILPDRQGILDQPKLPVKAVRSSQSGNQHWQVHLDRNGITGPDGHPITLHTKARRPITVIFDTGFTFNQVPKSVADRIYSRIPGSQFVNFTETGPIWTLPCNVEVNTTLVFGNKSFPIHPFDMNFSLKNSSGDQICVGGFQPITTGGSPHYDVILGMAFLRNAYLLINYGNFVDGTTTKAPPYVQLLSVTDPTAAHQDFINSRLGGATPTDVQTFATGTPDDVPVRDEGKTRAIIIGSVLGGCAFLLSVVVAVYIVWRRRRLRQSVQGSTSSTADMRSLYDHTAYSPLQRVPSPDETYPSQENHIEADRTSASGPSAEATRPLIAHLHQGYDDTLPRSE